MTDLICTFVADGDCSDQAAARMTIDPYDTGRAHSTMTLCYEHLNRWLDRIDNGIIPEPLALEFLDPPVSTPLVRWLWWSYDPDRSNSPVGRIRIAT